jgi:hypothetical protein
LLSLCYAVILATCHCRFLYLNWTVIAVFISEFALSYLL